MSVNSNVELDYRQYLDSIKERKYLSELEFKKSVENNFYLLHLFSEIVHKSSEERRFSGKTKMYMKEAKASLIVSYDLGNMNYISASKQVLRSSIEVFFRFCLSISKDFEFEENKKAGIYHSTDSLKNLQSKIDTHKIGKMTYFAASFFSTTDISSTVSSLNSLYSLFSSNVHVSSIEFMSPNLYLKEYTLVDGEKAEQYLRQYQDVLESFILIFYYFSLSMRFDSGLTKQDFIFIESIFSEDSITILNNIDGNLLQYAQFS